jgi:hypothetical protein
MLESDAKICKYNKHSTTFYRYLYSADSEGIFNVRITTSTEDNFLLSKKKIKNFDPQNFSLSLKVYISFQSSGLRLLSTS